MTQSLSSGTQVNKGLGVTSLPKRSPHIEPTIQVRPTSHQLKPIQSLIGGELRYRRRRLNYLPQHRYNTQLNLEFLQNLLTRRNEDEI